MRPRRSSCDSRACMGRAGWCAGRCLERGEPIPGDPQKFLNLIHIDDAAQAASAAALEAARPEPIYLVSDDRPVTRREYYTRMATLLGAPEPRFDLPRPAAPRRPATRPTSGCSTAA